MAKINLLKKSTAFDKDAGSYRMTLEVLSTENITKNVFVKQRLKNFVKNNFYDVFAAVSTPAQLEDLDEDTPSDSSSYYRTYKIDLISRNAAYLDDVLESILVELQKLVEDYEALENMDEDAIYSITAQARGDHNIIVSDITINQTMLHEHYRLPLVAEPSGLNEVYDDNGTNRHRVASQDTEKSGWLNTTELDPAGYKFKYNIAEDTALEAIWPPSADKISYAHLEVGGITADDVLITEDGIFWADNTEGNAPWPIDYVSHAVPSPSGEVVTLILDLIV